MCETTWYKIVGLLRSTCMLYKFESKWGCRFLLHGNKGTYKLQNPVRQAKSNVQSLIDLCVDTMLHQIKGIENGRQDMWRLLFDIWKNLREQSD
jgi:hypothetical protein